MYFDSTNGALLFLPASKTTAQHYNPRARRVLFMFLGLNVQPVVSIGKICQEFKSGFLTNPKWADFKKIDFSVGYPQIKL